MANISYGVNILPKTNNAYTLGNSDYKWNIYGSAADIEYIANKALTTGTRNEDYIKGYGSFTVGTNNIASGYYSVAMGNACAANGAGDFATGQYTSAIGGFSTAMGHRTTARYRYSVAIGRDNAVASIPTWVSGTSYSVGDIVDFQGTILECINATSETGSPSVSNWKEHFGVAFVVGNGTDENNRSNALTLLTEGKLSIKGDMYVNANANGSGGNKVATESYVNTTIGNIPAMTGATSSTAGAAGLVPAPATTDVDKFLAGDGTYKSGGLPMVILSYGNSTWAEFEAAYSNNVIVYCRASSNSNPASGSQTRMAFMAYVNNSTTPTEVEFQYYRSMSAHSATAMGDQVFVYKLTKTGGWSVTTREASIKQIKVDTGTALDVSWSSNVVTLTNTMTAADMPMSSSDVTTAKTEIDALKTFNEEENGIKNNISYTSTTGKYIGFNGSLASSAGWAYTDPIAVNAGDIIEVYARGYTTNVCMIALTNSTGSSYIPKVISTDSTLKSYFYTCVEDGYIACSYYESMECKITIRKKISNKALDARMELAEQNISTIDALKSDTYLNIIADNIAMTVGQEGKFIQQNNSLVSNDPFNLSTSISLPANSTIKVYAKGYQTNVAIIAKVNNDNTYTALVKSIDSLPHYYQYTTYDAINIVISSNKDTNVVYSIYSSKIDELEGKLDNIENDLFAFSTLGIIGDSLASGASNTQTTAIDRPNYSWGKFIERMYGVRTSLFSVGGMTTQSWLTSSSGITALNAAKPLDCYIIGLGQNDAYSLGDNYLGTISDVNVGSEDQNGDTYYGNYSKIIAAIKIKSPNAKIFCLTNALTSNQTKLDYNTAIRTIVPLYTNTYLVDLAADTFYTSSVFNNLYYGAHSTAAGYKVIAKNIHDNIVAVMQQNISDFLDIQWITEETGVTEMLPIVTSADNGKFLRVVNGAWAAATVPSASEVSF